MPQFTIKVLLPNDRDQLGTIELLDPFTGLRIWGPAPVKGKRLGHFQDANEA